jgi:hypothetical protein
MFVGVTAFAFVGKGTRIIASHLRIAVLSWRQNSSEFYGSVFLTKYVKFSVSNFNGLYLFVDRIPPRPPRSVRRISGIVEVLPVVGSNLPLIIQALCWTLRIPFVHADS